MELLAKKKRMTQKAMVENTTAKERMTDSLLGVRTFFPVAVVFVVPWPLF